MTKSLINICLDLIELDLDAPENKEIVDKAINQLGDKVDDYYYLDQFSNSQIEFLKKEREHLSIQIEKYEKLQERLRDKALAALNALNTDKVKSDKGHSFTRRESQIVEIKSLNDLPDWAVKKEVSFTPKKLEIKSELLAGKQVPGARLLTKEYAAISGPRRKGN